jgi:23S rRNA (guanosine2251-2'-O)-methyltransferase
MSDYRELIYGINPAFEVIRSGKRKIFKAYIVDSTNSKTSKLVNILKSKSIPIQFIDKGRLFNIIKVKNHQGVVLETEDYPYVPFMDCFAEDKLLLLDNIEDPHNLGAILRSAEIFGFKNILLPSKGSPEIYSSVVKVSTGASEHLKITRDMTANGYIKKSQEFGYKIIALDENGKTELSEMKELLNDKKFVLVIGGEDKSVGQFILNNADHIVRMRQLGKVNSLNASVAAGIAMYALS